MGRELLPGEGNDLFGEVEVLGEVLFALVVNEVVEVLPVEDEFDESAVLKGSEEGADIDVGDVGSLVWLGGVVLVDDDHSFLEEVSVDCLFLSFLDLDHGW